jgi:hypothetical protein
MPVSAPTRGRAAPKDSVELLLEGMGGPRPDRTKTTPQTGGEAAAAYHAEHSLRAGHAGHDEDVKVLVDTVRLPPAAETDEMGLRFAAEPTFILPSRQGPRIVVAALAGLLVVVAIFAYLDREARQAAVVAAPQAPLPGEALTRAAVASPEVPRPAEIPMPVAPAAAEPARAAPQPVAEAPAAPAVVEAPPPAAAPAAVASRTRATGHVQKSPGDMGEFKSSF